RHGYGHLVKRNAVKQDFHVFDAVDGDARFSDISYYAWMIGIIAAMRSQVKSDRKPFLAHCQVPAVKCVAFFCCRESGILADGPWARYIHRRVRPAHVRSKSR